MRTHRLFLCAFTALALGATLAHAQHATPAAAKQALKTLADQKGIQSHEIVKGNVTRLAINVNSADQLNAVQTELGKGKNVLQIVHFASRSSMHTLAMFDGELVHLQTPDGFRNWRLNVWGQSLRPSSNKMYSALIHLTPQESTNLRTRIANARLQQNASPAHVFGDAFGARSMNCASGWCGVPIGGQGEPLWRLVGLNGDSGHPHDFQLSLENIGNERVFGLAIYGPKLEGFAANPQTPIFQLNEP